MVLCRDDEYLQAPLDRSADSGTSVRIAGSAGRGTQGHRQNDQRGPLTLNGNRDPTRLGRYFEAYALNSAGLAGHKTLYDAAGINRKTALAYERLLKNLMVVDELPAWTSNRLKRLVLSPKRYLIDSALLAGCLALTLQR